ncbi:Serine/threonine protein kinase PrkC, regulator of stationary phase [Lachnospiraceae bacterium TWA4]|nr:Serine/threonine protein kinase PrkC, regulator of stationary phase [Lachnospiraceae bacterium TWA4]
MDIIGRFLNNRYELLSSIGAGGMADIYKALDHTLNRYVAIKVLKKELNSDETFVLKFRQEAMAAASLSHPNVVNIYDVGQENDINYIVMELCEGVTLKEYIRKKGKLDISDTINIAIQIANGIQAAHDKNIIHRDIKPQNVIITMDGKVKVTDFGIAKAVSSQTITANTVGSVHYISPEQARGSHCDGRSDIYSLGITIYEMLTGRVPFDGDSAVAVALLHIQGEMIPPSVYEPMIPVSLEKIVMKCTQKKPEMRYDSALDLISDLRKALMTPNEDFVKIIRLDTSGETHTFSEEEAKKIKEQTSGAKVPVTTKEETDYQLGIDEEEEHSQDLDLEDEDINVDSKFERVIMAIGIGVLVIIIAIAVFLVGRTFNIFPLGISSNKTETTKAVIEETLGVNQTRMPSVVGKTLEQASDLLAEANLGRILKEEESNEYDPGYVIRADYEEGKILEKNTQVTLYISVTSNTVTIPESIIGKKEKAATNALVKLGLIAKIETKSSETAQKGTVFDCNPSVGKNVKVGSEVTVYVSTGPTKTMVKVPDIYLKTQEEAEALLKESNLVGKVTYNYDDSIVKGKVISQEPKASSKTEEGSTVSYVISLGAEEVLVEVPSVTGKTLEEAKELLKENKLSVGSVTEQYDSAKKGEVISQSVISGTQVSENTSVDLVVSKGEKPVEQETETERQTNEPTDKKPDETQAPPTVGVERVEPTTGDE